MYRRLTNPPMSSTFSTHCSPLPHPPTQQTCTDISLTHPWALHFLPAVPHFLILQHNRHVQTSHKLTHELYTFYPLFPTSSSSNTTDMYRHLTNSPMSSTLSTHCSPLPHPPTQQTCTDILLTHPWALHFLPTVPHFLILQHNRHVQTSH